MATSRDNQATSSRIRSACFGRGNQRQSGLPVKPEATITEALDDVIRTESESVKMRAKERLYERWNLPAFSRGEVSKDEEKGE